MFSLNGKIAVVTGGSSGIGKCTAERFAKAGVKVVIAARHDETNVAAALGGEFIKTDVASEEDVRLLMERTVGRFGRIDILVNSAGTFSGSRPLVEKTTQEMTRAFAVNTLGVFYGMKHVAQYMQRGSSIVNVSSLAAVTGFSGYTDYTASKYALNGITRAAAIEFGPLGIRVNCVCPSTVNTPMLWSADVAETEAALCRMTSALDATIEPEEVAAVIHFLAADDCPKITGQEIVVDAGITAGYSLAAYDAMMKAAGLVTG
jgi:NAD(P)-dependent dehydrogenase (short-subunit alcohol dehydrogenase family)